MSCLTPKIFILPGVCNTNIYWCCDACGEVNLKGSTRMRDKDKNPSTHKIILAVGLKFKETREAMDYTQTEMAELLSFESDTPVDTKTVLRWEQGINKLPAWVPFYLDMVTKEHMSSNHDKGIKAFLLKFKNLVQETILKLVDQYIKKHQ